MRGTLAILLVFSGWIIVAFIDWRLCIALLLISAGIGLDFDNLRRR